MGEKIFQNLETLQKTPQSILVVKVPVEVDIYIVACQAHPALVKRSGVRTVFISLLVNTQIKLELSGDNG